ncbi:helix-turn-helix domain-containing protein [Paenibacillus sp. GCM10027627]|uniref:helix-turn-helix domain-containing protein n=1 Tax=unclassified Paenibacillus TaxID=185978 RepID=UPI003637237E
MERINLDDSRIMNSKDAAKRWGKDDSSIRFRKNDFPSGTLRKIGRDWVVTEEGMEAVFGKENNNS